MCAVIQIPGMEQQRTTAIFGNCSNENIQYMEKKKGGGGGGGERDHHLVEHLT